MVLFCPEHGLTIHSSGFVYYNGDSEEDRIIATKRNLMFHADYYISNFFENRKIGDVYLFFNFALPFLFLHFYMINFGITPMR
jgi:hypothetical protein